MKNIILLFAALSSFSCFAECNTFGNAMEVVATKVDNVSKNHGPIAMAASCGAAETCSASGNFEIVAIYDDGTEIKKAMTCRFLDTSTCAPTVCVVNYAAMYR